MKIENKNLTQLQNTLWELCKKIVRLKYPHNCYTCPQMGLEASNMHTGHYYPDGALGASMKYDLRILRLQCYNCNINLGGMGGVYRENMRKEIGVEAEQKLFDECRLSKGKPIKARDYYIKLIYEYENKLKELQQMSKGIVDY